MLRGIKNIIFDLGGVIYAIDYQATIRAFEALGIKDFEEVYAKVGQSDLFDRLEIGKISKDVFFQEIKRLIASDISNQDITDAWNAMLMGFMPDALDCLSKLNGDYRIFLLSNTNEIHIQDIKSRVGEVFYSDFCQLFEQVYLSHDLGLRKPHTEVFKYILDEQGLEPNETLFIDDSPQHIDGARKVGIKAYHLKDDEPISSVLNVLR
jgi:putative hydrolase of the HAD superfamily